MATSGETAIFAPSLLGAAEVNEVHAAGRAMARGWADSLGDLLVYRGVPLERVLATSQYHTFQEVLAAERIAARLPDFSALVLERPPSRPCDDEVSYDVDHDVFEAVLEREALRRGRPVEYVEGASPRRGAGGAVRTLRSFAGRHLRRAIHRATGRPRERVRLSAWRPSGPPVLLGVGGGGELQILRCLLDRLAETGRVETLAFSWHESLDPAVGRFGLERPFRTPFIAAGDLRPRRDLTFDSRAAEARRRLEALSRDGLGALGFQNDHLWRVQIPSAARAVDLAIEVVDRMHPSGILAASGHDVRAAAALAVGRRRGVVTAMTPHGGWMGDIHPYESEAERFLAQGEIGREMVERWFGMAPSSIHVIGAPFMDAAAEPTESPRPRAEGGVREILAITGGLHEGAHCPVEMAAYRETWRALVDLVRSRPDLRLRIKPRPSFDYGEKYLEWFAGGGDPRISLWSGSLEGALVGVDAAVSVGYLTTASLVALERGVPHVYAEAGHRANAAWEAYMKPVGDLWVARRPVDVEAQVRSLVDDPEARRSCVEAGRRFLRADILVDAAKVRRGIEGFLSLL